jgi:hypothetical protein
MREAGALDRAVVLYREVIARARTMDGMPAEERGRLLEAAINNLALALDQKGETEEAIAALEELARMKSGDRTVQEALKLLRKKRK